MRSLAVKGSQLIYKDTGEKAVLRGISTHGLQWFPQYVNEPCFRTLKDQWNANVIRLAMYVEEGGYTQDGAMNGKSYSKMVEGIDACIRLGLYVIVDWHVSNADQTPKKHWGEAKDFFASIALHYKDVPNVLYEICNEPNGAGNDYADEISFYAGDIIFTIRSFSPGAVVIIGSGHWSKDAVAAWEYETHMGGKFENALYTLHHYNDGDFDQWSPAIRDAVSRGCPIFATECGVSNSSETDKNTGDEFMKLIDFYEGLGISWCVWSLADKDEPSSILTPGAPSSGSWTSDEISKAGYIVRNELKKFAPDQSGPVIPTTPPLPGEGSKQELVLESGQEYEGTIVAKGQTVKISLYLPYN